METVETLFKVLKKLFYFYEIGKDGHSEWATFGNAHVSVKIRLCVALCRLEVSVKL